MRVIIDTTVLVSYLLHPSLDRTPARVLHAVFAGRVDLFISETLLNELMTTVHNKPYLQSRISEHQLVEFIARLESIATITPEISEPIPAISRDPDDDYLIAHAIAERIDYLISGDNDLQVFREFEGVRIVSPAEFVQVLDL